MVQMQTKLWYFGDEGNEVKAGVIIIKKNKDHEKLVEFLVK